MILRDAIGRGQILGCTTLVQDIVDAYIKSPESSIIFMSQLVYAFIPARSGSQGLKHKNILPIDGHPLMAYAIAFGHALGIDRVSYPPIPKNTLKSRGITAPTALTSGAPKQVPARRWKKIYFGTWRRTSPVSASRCPTYGCA